MYQLILLRHGESLWNREERFTGWTDVELTDRGIEEARRAAAVLETHQMAPEACFTSFLKRAVRTLWIVLEELDRMWLPVETTWRLNERHYGALQGLDKNETAAREGEERVHAWRRSYTTRPPPLTPSDSRYPGHDPRYRTLRPDEIPRTESLQDTLRRTIPYWNDAIAPMLQSKETVLVSAHGNSLRALIKYLEKLSDRDIEEVEIPTGVPLLYQLGPDLNPKSHAYLRT